MTSSIFVTSAISPCGLSLSAKDFNTSLLTRFTDKSVSDFSDPIISVSLVSLFSSTKICFIERPAFSASSNK